MEIGRSGFRSDSEKKLRHTGKGLQDCSSPSSVSSCAVTHRPFPRKNEEIWKRSSIRELCVLSKKPRQTSAPSLTPRDEFQRRPTPAVQLNRQPLSSPGNGRGNRRRYPPLRARFPHPKHLTERSLEGIRGNSAEDAGDPFPCDELNFGLLCSNCSRKSVSSTFSGSPCTRGIDGYPADRTMNGPLLASSGAICWKGTTAIRSKAISLREWKHPNPPDNDNP